MVKEIIWIFVGKGGVDLKLLEKQPTNYIQKDQIFTNSNLSLTVLIIFHIFLYFIVILLLK
jgi:hypothetical protein